MADERTSEREMPSSLRSAMIIGIRGRARRRKPVTSAKAILRSDVDDLAVVSCGGPLGMAGKL
ncbi:hypothetical protein AB0I53_25415 [Saccharopolyspora sp. NPDC050389]|uniref:hypothetical protein n=1 Tax=Saccharopolyspora sp. NPDC050389 TaxID=3155516 RepID=UPI0033C74B07